MFLAKAVGRGTHIIPGTATPLLLFCRLGLKLREQSIPDGHHGYLEANTSF